LSRNKNENFCQADISFIFRRDQI